MIEEKHLTLDDHPATWTDPLTSFHYNFGEFYPQFGSKFELTFTWAKWLEKKASSPKSEFEKSNYKAGDEAANC